MSAMPLYPAPTVQQAGSGGGSSASLINALMQSGGMMGTSGMTAPSFGQIPLSSILDYYKNKNGVDWLGLQTAGPSSLNSYAQMAGMSPSEWTAQNTALVQGGAFG